MRARSMKSSIPGGPHDRTLHELRNPDKPRANHRSHWRRMIWPVQCASTPRRASTSSVEARTQGTDYLNLTVQPERRHGAWWGVQTGYVGNTLDRAHG